MILSENENQSRLPLRTARERAQGEKRIRGNKTSSPVIEDSRRYLSIRSDLHGTCPGAVQQTKIGAAAQGDLGWKALAVYISEEISPKAMYMSNDTSSVISCNLSMPQRHLTACSCGWLTRIIQGSANLYLRSMDFVADLFFS